MRVSENHQKVIRLSWKTSEIIRRSSEGHHKVISRLSGGHQRVIRGSSGGHQKYIYFSSQICIALKLFWFQVSFQKLFWALMIFFLLFFSSTSPSMVAAAAAYTNMYKTFSGTWKCHQHLNLVALSHAWKRFVTYLCRLLLQQP